MWTSIKKIKEGTSIVKRLGPSVFVPGVAPADGVLIQEENGPAFYVRLEDLMKVLEEEDGYQWSSDPWREDGKSQTESIPEDDRR